MKPLLLSLVLLTCLPARADWVFSASTEITAGKSVFHHLEASGRQSLALANGDVGIVWEDDHSGAPRCYLGLKSPAQSTFNIQSFGQGECFAPGIAALDQGRFGLIWEDEAGVQTATVNAAKNAGKIGPALQLAAAGGNQGSLAWHPAIGLVAAWTQPDNRWRQIWLARVNIDGTTPALISKRPIETTPTKDDQLYPTLTPSPQGIDQGISVAWEDRRLGHTVIFASHSADAITWTAPARVSNNPTGKAQGTDLGRGTGAMRPVLVTFGQRLAAIWLDKRDFLSGYDVYGALADANAKFTKNKKVQDSFGDAIAQWHPAAAANSKGQLVVAWDDDRDGSSDIWLSALGPGDAFSENFTLPAASGPVKQTDPVLALDEAGNLHLAWVQHEPDGRSSIQYSVGKPKSGNH